jgi:hypothetical protein
MTAQINDVFRYRGSEYSLSGISEDKLFDISVLGLEPISTCTACWRGYLAFFAIADTHLVVDDLHASLYLSPGAKDAWIREEGPVINGVTPKPADSDRDWFNNFYKGLNYHLEYSGGLLLTKNFISELYVHMGFHPAWKYETVIELVFERGTLTKEADRSEQMAELSTMMRALDGVSPPTAKRRWRRIRLFVDEAFDRRYEL